MIDYRARYETEWRDLSSRHKNLRIRAEENLVQFIVGQSVPNIAIAGPYGMGKSQLLLHLMKVVLQNGGLAFYSHAATLLSLAEQDMNATEFSNRIRQAVQDEIIALNSRVKDPLEIDETLADIIRQHFPHGISNVKVVLLIDEWEQVYQELQNKIKTDDRNPLRALLDDPSLHLVLAFAPKSVYEFGTVSSLGSSEADRRRMTVFRIPTLLTRRNSASI